MMRRSSLLKHSSTYSVSGSLTVPRVAGETLFSAFENTVFAPEHITFTSAIQELIDKLECIIELAAISTYKHP